MNDILTYPIGIIILFLTWLIIFKKRKDLRRRLWVSGLCMTPVTLMEYWCLKDYWNPPGPYFFKFISIENIIFFFFITGICVTVFDTILKKRNVKKLKRNKITIYLYPILIIVSLLFFTSYLKYNSILVICFTTLLFTCFILYSRKDLIIPSIITGIIMTIYAITSYTLLFNILFVEYWDKYWLLNNSAIGGKILGNIPLTELLWYFSWSSFCVVFYNYVDGQIKENRSV